MRVAADIEVAAPAASIWEFIADPSRALHYMSGITRWEVVGDQPTGLGARYRMLLRVGSAEVGGLIEIVEFTPNQDMAWTTAWGPGTVIPPSLEPFSSSAFSRLSVSSRLRFTTGPETRSEIAPSSPPGAE